MALGLGKFHQSSFCGELIDTIVGVRKMCFVLRKMNVTLRKVISLYLLNRRLL